MRIRICLLTILTALPAGWAQTDPPAALTVPDAAPRAVLEDSLGLAAEAPIMAAELTDLGARDAGVARLAEAHEATRSAKGSTTRSRGDPVPSRSIPVRIVTDTRTTAAAVARLLKGRGVTSDIFGAGGSGTRGILRADVPVPLLARLSEQPDVLGVSEEVPPRADNTGTQAGSNRSGERETQTTAEGDSVQVATGDVEREPVYLGHRIRGLGGSRHAAVRIPTKVVFGTLFCMSVTAISASLYDTYIEGETEYRDDPWGGLDSVHYGLIAGSALGFPAGVTAIDPDDSLLGTLLAGVIPAAAGLYLLTSESPAAGFLLVWVSPPVFSLATSELWRNPSQDHRSSFAVAPASMGGLSAVTTLPF